MKKENEISFKICYQGEIKRIRFPIDDFNQLKTKIALSFGIPENLSKSFSYKGNGKTININSLSEFLNAMNQTKNFILTTSEFRDETKKIENGEIKQIGNNSPIFSIKKPNRIKEVETKNAEIQVEFSSNNQVDKQIQSDPDSNDAFKKHLDDQATNIVHSIFSSSPLTIKAAGKYKEEMELILKEISTSNTNLSVKILSDCLNSYKDEIKREEIERELNPFLDEHEEEVKRSQHKKNEKEEKNNGKSPGEKSSGENNQKNVNPSIDYEFINIGEDN